MAPLLLGRLSLPVLLMVMARHDDHLGLTGVGSCLKADRLGYCVLDLIRHIHGVKRENHQSPVVRAAYNINIHISVVHYA